MSNQSKQAELAAMKKIAEGHKLLLHAMLTNNEAYLALLKAAEETSSNSKIQDSRFKDSKMKVLR